MRKTANKYTHFKRNMALLPLTVAALGLAAGSACTTHHHHEETVIVIEEGVGDLAFNWSFDGLRRCASAGVSEVDVQLVDGHGHLVFGDTVPCVGGGLDILDLPSGHYTLWLDAFDTMGVHRYAAEIPVALHPDVLNDLGTLDLAPLGRSDLGALRLYWGFLYPTDDSLLLDCLAAGAEEIDVELIPLFSEGTSHVETFDCYDEGIQIENLVAGPYDLRISAYGLYQDAWIYLFGTGDIPVDVRADSLVDLGDVPLYRDEGAFADIELTWELSVGACELEGVYDIEFSVIRLGPDLEEDVFSVPCDATYAVRHTFVPGSYLIEAFAEGDYGPLFGAATVDAPPGSVGITHVELVPES
jgi:hypothetical protein